MKKLATIFIISISVFACNLLGQTNQAKKLYIPFLDKESQSNVLITVSDIFGEGEACPMTYTNSLSNSNLFTPKQQNLIKEVFVKYKNVTTNSGPPGTVLAGFYKTNYVVKAMNKRFTNELWVANFQYTNFDAHEEIRIGSGMLAEFRNKSNDGYGVSFTRTGGGTLLNFLEIKHDLPNGLLVRFADLHAQGMTWNYKFANFTNAPLVEYRQCTNGLVFGTFLMWNPLNGNLNVAAKFKEPYDFEKHRIDLRKGGHKEVRPNY